MNAPRDIAPPRRPANPAGRSALAFRLATQPVFRRWMQQRLRQPTLTLPDGTVIDNALQPLNPDDPHGFVPGLLGAWAAIGDILTFYQERIANEGYLATAIESLSVRALAAEIGYRPRPALSAQTHLAFTLREVPGAPERLTVPRGTAIQSVPPPGQSPALFETDQDIEARPEWNTLKPLLAPPAAKPQIVGSAVRLRVAGNLTELRPGMPIVLHGLDRHSGEKRVLVRQLTTVDVVAGATTTLGWRGRLKDSADQRPDDAELLTAPEVLMFRKTAKLFGASAPDWSRQPASVKAKLGRRIGDVAIAASPGAWNVVNAGLPPDEVSALAIDEEGTIFAAAGDGVIAYAPEQPAWTPTGALARRSTPGVLIAPGRGILYAGTQRGEVMCSVDRGATWFALVGHGPAPKGSMPALPAAPVRVLAVMPGPQGVAAVVAGTPFGIWCTSANGGNWEPWNAGLPGYDAEQGSAIVIVNALVRDRATERWIAATDQGLFHADAFGADWHAAHALDVPPPAGSPPAPERTDPIAALWRALRLGRGAAPAPTQAPTAPAGAAAAPPAAGLPPAEPTQVVHALAILPGASGATIFAGTEHGVQHSTNARRWHPASRLPGAAGDLPVTHLAVGEAGLFAGTSKGLFQSSDAGATWSPVAAPFAAQPIAALATGAGRVAAAGAFGGYQDQDWPDFLVAGRQIDLDRAYPALVPGSWIVLAQDPPDGGAERTMVAGKVVSASVVQRQAFQTTGSATRVTIETTSDARFNPRTTTVYIYSRALDLFDDSEPSPTLLGADSGPIALAGAIEGLAGRLISISGRRAGARRVGRAGSAPAAADDTVTEICRIDGATVAPDRSRTDVVPSARLKNVYDAATVSINANVAPASHGESPPLYEVIGSGDNSQPNQSFVLKRKSVTALATADAPGFQFEITISVRPGLPSEPLDLSGQLRPRDVDDHAVAWRRVETLSGSGPNDPHYMLRERDNDTIVVTFGDGVHGMRLPTGRENVLALYRTGSGPNGNVDAGTLILPRKRPAGVGKVTNPVPATGGTSREQNHAIRQTAPITVRTLGRIVSFGDYEDFVRARPGVAKAKGALLALPARRGAVVHVTVAGADGASPSREVDGPGLLDAIRRNRAVDGPVRIDNFVPRRFALSADLVIDPGRAWSDVCAKVGDALLARFGFAARELAEPVHAADVVACMQDVRGVRAVHLTALHASGSNPDPNATLTAAAAHWIDAAGGAVAPAELLMLADANSIVLNEVKT